MQYFRCKNNKANDFYMMKLYSFQLLDWRFWGRFTENLYNRVMFVIMLNNFATDVLTSR